MPVAMKTPTAAKDLTDNLPKPQTPWPLVQPLPQTVPMPTKSPAGMSKYKGLGGMEGISNP
jgi:hypothetical protein